MSGALEEPSEPRSLSEAESLRLLASAPFGRVVFSRDALPAVGPVDHVVDSGSIVIRARLGWSVIVIGVAKRITEPDESVRLDGVLKPWVRGTMDHLVRIVPEVVTGFDLVPALR
ncbi:pyridoxamine 5'-phosphate oxidase family protein [Umezawaea sp. NPDC059074]|uniref:pyridoxamine 5'-phosphate oxidase family protein n=1 Tax=Umezawaea sp. NPDC059074 TaxID=3346716 RepID=UPI003674E991